MKNFAFAILVVLLAFSADVTLAQQPPATVSLTARPCLFSKFPEVIKCTALQLNSLFAIAQQQQVTVNFEDVLTLAGTVKSNEVKYANLQTLIIKLPAFNNILFSLSKIVDENNKVIYTGHLFNNAFADGYELKKIDYEHYQLIKISMAKLLPACNQ